jgi:hypothetical protein
MPSAITKMPLMGEGEAPYPYFLEAANWLLPN